MRILALLVLFLTAIVLCGPANAAPLPNVDMQQPSAGINVDFGQYPDQINNGPILVTREDPSTKFVTSRNLSKLYLAGGSSGREILPTTAATLPEPPSLLLLGSGILALAIIGRHRLFKA